MVQKTAVITGASTGIGLATAHKLAALGWRIIAVGRDPDRCAAAEAQLKAAYPLAQVTILRADFDSMAQVANCAKAIADLTASIDVLINNAGGVRDRKIITADGTEATFAANHLAPFLLTRTLMPQLIAGKARVIAVSSTAHRHSKGLDFADLQWLQRDAPSPTAMYCDAKLANLLFTRELARLYGGDGLIAQAMHPGTVASNFASHGDSAMQSHMAAAAADAPDVPADTLVWMAMAAECGSPGGRYFYKLAEETQAAVALDDAASARLWEHSTAILEKLAI